MRWLGFTILPLIVALAIAATAGTTQRTAPGRSIESEGVTLIRESVVYLSGRGGERGLQREKICPAFVGERVECRELRAWEEVAAAHEAEPIDALIFDRESFQLLDGPWLRERYHDRMVLVGINVRLRDMKILVREGRVTKASEMKALHAPTMDSFSIAAEYFHGSPGAMATFEADPTAVFENLAAMPTSEWWIHAPTLMETMPPDDPSWYDFGDDEQRSQAAALAGNVMIALETKNGEYN